MSPILCRLRFTNNLAVTKDRAGQEPHATPTLHRCFHAQQRDADPEMPHSGFGGRHPVASEDEINWIVVEEMLAHAARLLNLIFDFADASQFQSGCGSSPSTSASLLLK
jgi:hypothetical protein